MMLKLFNLIHWYRQLRKLFATPIPCNGPFDVGNKFIYYNDKTGEYTNEDGELVNDKGELLEVKTDE